TDRNRNKITREEQALLATKKVGVVGLSVGQAVSVTMALERCFGEIRLADFDTLDLSNLNRIRTGTGNLGLNKAIVTAREIAEIDPYLKVTCFTDGLTKENMDAFFTEGGKLDILVEECDSVDIKILARQKAKALRIPVVMDMSDRGCLDVERFDLEPDRPLMHGWIDHLDLEAASQPMTAEEKVPYMLPITGVETLSPRMKASVIELGQTVSTWPQLATSVVLGGALAGDAVRRIALNEFKTSGRWFVDLEEIIADPPAPTNPAPSIPDAFALRTSQLEELEKALGPVPSETLDPGKDVIEQLVEAGGLAPSAGNMQPWKFLWHGKRLFLFHDESRSSSFWDPDHLIAHIALGACVENIVLKAHALDFEVKSTLFPVEQVSMLTAVFEFRTVPDAETEPHVADELAAMIGVRCTNRKFPQPGPLPDGTFSRMEAMVATMQGCKAHLLDSREELSLLADLCGASERIRAINPIGHREFFAHEVRWTPEEARLTKDGLDMATMELRPIDLAGMQVAADPRAMGLIDRWRTGKGLEGISGPVIRASPAAVLVSHTHDTYTDRLNASRAMERLWMMANAEGLSVHPISAAIFLTHALKFEMKGLRDHEREELERIRADFATLWHLNGRHPLFLIRLAPGGQPSVRSYRLDTHELLLPCPQTTP
ncbi:MAG: Rv1355c family protein, partial [Flavobacteriales bacterium]